MKIRLNGAVLCLFVVALSVVSLAGPAHAKNNSGNEAAIKRIEEEIKAYEKTLKAAQERMKAANEKGAEVEPLIDPAEKQLRDAKTSMEDQQRERATASREMQETIKSDPSIEEARLALEQAEDRRDLLTQKLMPDIKAEEEYQELAAKRDRSEAYLKTVKQEGRELDIPGAATAFAKDQGALSSYVQDRLSSIPAYKTVEGEVGKAQSHRRETERAVSKRCREESGLESIDAIYAEKRDAYQESRESLRDLERKFKSLRSAYEDAKDEAKWAARRIALHQDRIATLKRRK